MIPLRRVGSTTNGGASLCAVVQDSLDAAVFQVVGLVESSCHFGMVRLVSTCSAVAAEGSTEFIRARDAGEFAYGRDDQGADARNGRSDDNDGVFDITPANEFDTASSAKIGDSGELVQFCSLDNGSNHGTIF